MRKGAGLIKLKYYLLITISCAVVAADQLAKLYVHTRFHLSETVQVIPNFFDLTYIRNYGAAFGFLSQVPNQFREPFFAIIPVLALVVILFILRTTKDTEKIQIFALSLVFGGAFGNYIDRLRLGYVIDFLDFHVANRYHWPAFNIADTAIVAGVGILLLQSLFEGRSQTEVEKKVQHDAARTRKH